MLRSNCLLIGLVQVVFHVEAHHFKFLFSAMVKLLLHSGGGTTVLLEDLAISALKTRLY